MAEPEQAQVAIVMLIFMDGERQDGNVTVSGRSDFWVTEDMTCAHTLREQLVGLLGNVASEAIMPKIAAEELKDPGPWPGMVKFVRDG